ncbi:MAG: nucleotide pyrophosphohydrolase [Proteobacteria bacterium]|nr:MAG: nucleotide pyrophosphohydrolase [Pseudomonadota bacterium]
MSTQPTSVQSLQDAIRAFCEARDWDRFHGAKDLAIGVATEAGELLEHFRFRSEDEVDALFRDPSARDEIAGEMADVAIFLLRMAQRYEIDLGRAVLDKLAVNAKRYPVETSRGSNRKAE